MSPVVTNDAAINNIAITAAAIRRLRSLTLSRYAFINNDPPPNIVTNMLTNNWGFKKDHLPL